MDSDDGAPDDGVLDGLNLGADVDQYNVPAPVVLPASGSTTAAPVQAVVRVDGAGGSGGPSAPPPRFIEICAGPGFIPFIYPIQCND